jgi:hypothetical protein
MIIYAFRIQATLATSKASNNIILPTAASAERDMIVMMMMMMKDKMKLKTNSFDASVGE